MNNTNKKAKSKRMIICTIISFALVIVCTVIGVLVRNALLSEVTIDGKIEKQLPPEIAFALSVTAGVCLGILVVGVIVNLIISALYTKRIKNMSRVVSEMNTFITSKRDDVESTVKVYLKKLTRTIMISDALCALYLVCNLVFTISLMIVSPGYNYLFVVMFWINLAVLLRIRLTSNKPEPEQISDIEIRAKRDEYPTLYAIADKAADKFGIKNKPKIYIVGGDFNVSILDVRDEYMLIVGGMALLLFSDKELYNVFLHEFGHVCDKNRKEKKIRKYSLFLDKEYTVFHSWVSLFFSMFNYIFSFDYMVYDYAVSVRNEKNADEYMAKYGDKEIAASALLKLKYHDLYNWECGSYDDSDFNIFESESMDSLKKEYIIKYSVQLFKERLEVRENFWRELVDKEILARNASHPTTAMRLETLGVSDCKLVWERSDEYDEEVEKAVGILQQLVCDDIEKTGYDKIRESNYLRPQREINEWEEKGEPLIADRYSDIISDLCALSRYTKAAQLAKRAVDELPAASSAYGLFYYGQYLLRCYSSEGLDYLYRAFGENRNSIEQGLGMIGQFCCITGLQDELDTYREKAMTLAQEEVDWAGEVSLLNPKDKLSSEYLEGNMMNELKELLANLDDGSIYQVYIVRKHITESFTCSPVIVRFRKDAKYESANEIMHRIFQYLDTVPNDWQFSLFEYDSVKNVPFKKVKDSLIYTGKNDNNGELKE